MPRSGMASAAPTRMGAALGPTAGSGRPLDAGAGWQDTVVAAVPILIRILPSVGEMTVTLVIDSAGKVRSATPSGSAISNNAEQMNAISGWKFVPAFRDHQAVASSMVRMISLEQYLFHGTKTMRQHHRISTLLEKEVIWCSSESVTTSRIV